MSALPIGSRDCWYHGTHRAAAAAIMAEGFRLDAGGGHGRWYGPGVYVSERAHDAIGWAVPYASEGVVVVCRLAAGLRLDEFSVYDPAPIADLRRRFGKEILGKRPWHAVPGNKHLSRRDWAALYAYHVHHPDNHLGCGTARSPWFRTMSRIRSALAHTGGGGLYRRHGADPVYPEACEAVIFDPGQVHPISVHPVLGEVSGGEAHLGPAFADEPAPSALVAENRHAQAWEAILTLQDCTAWNQHSMARAVAAMAAYHAEYSEELTSLSTSSPFDPWRSMLGDWALAVLSCGRHLSNERLCGRMRVLLAPCPPATRRSMLAALGAASREAAEDPGPKAGGRDWSGLAMLWRGLRDTSSRPEFPL